GVPLQPQNGSTEKEAPIQVGRGKTQSGLASPSEVRSLARPRPRAKTRILEDCCAPVSRCVDAGDERPGPLLRPRRGGALRGDTASLRFIPASVKLFWGRAPPYRHQPRAPKVRSEPPLTPRNKSCAPVNLLPAAQH